MPLTRSRSYEKIHDQVWDDYADPKWEAGRRWLSRVGRPRLIAEAALWEARSLIFSINANLFSRDPEVARKFYLMRDAVDEFVGALAEEHWRRFRGEK